MGSGDNARTCDDAELDESIEATRRNRRIGRLGRVGRKPRPLILSRYVLLGQLGSGGTSMVYKAYDPQLDRKVALKLLQARRESSPRAQTRLMREAQAMARLTHPHVVTVHDVSEYSARDLGVDPSAPPPSLEVPAHGVFIVMELVEGGDLRRWLGRRHRPWHAVLEVMQAAGRGLAAAHEVGIVHRDFKPGNILIGDDGRILVSDFGLARAAIPSNPSSPERIVNAASSGSWDDNADITREGAVLGTPPYMSPEQHRGDGSDPRSDQFGFGVTLYEALFGVRPFHGSMAQLREAKDDGRWRPIPSGTDVPARVIAVLERSLQPDPEHRFTSMHALLDALERASRPRITPRTLAAIAGATLVTAVPFTVWSGADDPCTAGLDHVERVWGPEHRQAVREAFERSPEPYARAAGTRVQAEIDAWTDRWLTTYRDACEATHVRHEQSQGALDLRFSCLGHDLLELEVMTTLIRDEDPRAIENAVASVHSLSDIRRCDDVAALSARIAPPDTPQARAKVDAGYRRLAEARAQELAGHYENAVTITRDIANEALALDYAPLAAAANYRMATSLGLMGKPSGAEERLLDAILQAERSRDEQTAADAWIDLVWMVGVEQARQPEALRWARFAEAALDRVGRDPLRRAALDHNRAGVLYRLGRYDEALTLYERAYEVQRERLGEHHPLVAQTVNHLGNVLIMQGRYDEARTRCEQALAIRRRTLGPDHPRVAAPLNNIAEILSRQGDLEGALHYAEQALDITRDSERPEELIAWVLVARQHQRLAHPRRELEARRRVLTLLDDHPDLDQSRRAEHLQRVVALSAPGESPTPASAERMLR